MRGRAAAFDALLRGLILFLVVATPLALGTIDEISLAAFQWLSVALGLIWILRAAWVTPGAPPEAAAAGGEERAGLRIFGHGTVSTGLGLPIALFVALVAWTLVPLPPSVVRLVSPSTARLHSTSLPGFEAGGQVDFAATGSFLLGPGHDEVVGRILRSPAEIPEGLSTQGSRLRPISIYPFATAGSLVFFLCLCILFVVALHAFQRRSHVEWLQRWVVLFGFALALFGIVQRLSWNGRIYWWIPVDPAASPFGPFVNHNHFAAFLAMVVPIAAGLLMDEARKLIPRRGEGRLFATHGPEPIARLLLAAFVVAVMAGAVVLSASRGAILALVAALVLYGGALVVQGRIGRAETAVVAVLLLIAMALSFWLGVGPLAEKLRAIGDVESEPSLFSRVLGYRATVDIIRSFPLFGTGLGTFQHAWKHHYPPGTAAVWHEAHNDYLQLFAEAGGAGFVIFLAAAGIFAWRYLLPGILRGGAVHSYAMHGTVMGILAVAFHSIVDFPLQIAGCAVLFVVLSAVVISWRKQMEKAS